MQNIMDFVWGYDSDFFPSSSFTHFKISFWLLFNHAIETAPWDQNVDGEYYWFVVAYGNNSWIINEISCLVDICILVVI